MVFIDSNVWIGYFNGNDKHHGRAFEIINSIKLSTEPKIVITSGILHEVINHLFKIKGKRTASDTMKTILSIPNLSVLFLTDEIWIKTMENFDFYEFGLTDAQIISAMEYMNDNMIYSFDSHFDQVKWLKRFF